MNKLMYSAPLYFIAFLPAVIMLYQLCPQKFRKYVLLVANYVFFYTWSKFFLVYQVITMVITYVSAKIIDHTTSKKTKKFILFAAIVINLGVLVILKYTNFFGENIFAIFHQRFTAVHFITPIGISYYTLQMISYLMDTSSGKIHSDHSIVDFAVYASFFPTLIQGPITRFNEIKDSIHAGNPITYQNLKFGSQRILFGLMKKMIIADRLDPAVSKIFTSYTQDGLFSLIGAVLCTIQLYMDFSGIVDICLGSAEIFGIKLPENFRQPFFAENASDFWRRWHITLGTFLRDYVFYPVSLAKPIRRLSKFFTKYFGKAAGKFIGPFIALFAVWFLNGLWHGPYWSYIFYGLYYFCFMVLEILLKKPVDDFLKKHQIDNNHIGLRIFRFVKLLIIVIIGELFFRAKTLAVGWAMFSSIFTNFDLSTFKETLPFLRLDVADWMIVLIGIVVIFLVDFYKEFHGSIRNTIEQKPTWMRWSIIYTCIFTLLIFGAYGPGYDIVAMIYAEF
ncbi:MBOAT family O-acyltransferase [uncultured Solobacterium sp.]|uniref:MBOAT family O-acyltransferase n=1 Tax=uncultured Solobacterium sp. TaxID=747375 RepID=UPI0028E26809|nr:MBOAT family O-acyltransferase [uncultured Solobacterium sp.]